MVKEDEVTIVERHKEEHLSNGIIFFFFLGWSNIALEKAMTPHSSTLAWKIPWMEEPGGL